MPRTEGRRLMESRGHRVTLPSRWQGGERGEVGHWWASSGCLEVALERGGDRERAPAPKRRPQTWMPNGMPGDRGRTGCRRPDAR